MLLIGARIQEYRKKAALSQEEFAEKLGVSRQAVSKWERDKAYPDLDRLVCICEILDVRADELIYGNKEIEGNIHEDETDAIVNNTVHMKNLRGGRRFIRLKTIFGVLMAICAFSLVVLTVLLARNEWTSHQDKNENVRVEKVYQQYTKADLCYFDENGRKVMNTVWLDIPGLRDGDYVECYTGTDNDSLFLNYRKGTILAAIVITVVFVLLLLLTGFEIRRMKKEDRLQIILEDLGEKTTDEEI